MHTWTWHLKNHRKTRSERVKEDGFNPSPKDSALHNLPNTEHFTRPPAAYSFIQQTTLSAAATQSQRWSPEQTSAPVPFALVPCALAPCAGRAQAEAPKLLCPCWPGCHTVASALTWEPSSKATRFPSSHRKTVPMAPESGSEQKAWASDSLRAWWAPARRTKAQLPGQGGKKATGSPRITAERPRRHSSAHATTAHQQALRRLSPQSLMNKTNLFLLVLLLSS